MRTSRDQGALDPSILSQSRKAQIAISLWQRCADGSSRGLRPYAGVRLACLLSPIGAQRHTEQAVQFF